MAMGSRKGSLPKVTNVRRKSVPEVKKEPNAPKAEIHFKGPLRPKLNLNKPDEPDKPAAAGLCPPLKTARKPQAPNPRGRGGLCRVVNDDKALSQQELALMEQRAAAQRQIAARAEKDAQQREAKVKAKRVERERKLEEAKLQMAREVEAREAKQKQEKQEAAAELRQKAQTAAEMAVQARQSADEAAASERAAKKAQAEKVALAAAEVLLQRQKKEAEAAEAAAAAEREKEEKAKNELHAYFHKRESVTRQKQERDKKEADEKAVLEKAWQRAEEAKQAAAAEQAKREAEARAKREAEEQVKQEAEARAIREAQERARQQARREADEKSKREAEEQARREAEAKRAAEAQAKREAEAEALRQAAEREARIAAAVRAEQKRASEKRAKEDLRRVEQLREEQKLRAEEMARSTLKLQALWRGRCGRQQHQTRKSAEERASHEVAVHKAVPKIQALLRGKLGRMRAAKLAVKEGSIDEFEYPSILEETVIPFRPNKDSFSSSAKKIVFALMQIAGALKQCRLKVYVEGSVRQRENPKLGRARAVSVRSELMGLGVPGHQLRCISLPAARSNQSSVCFKIIQEIRLKNPIRFSAGSPLIPQSDHCDVAMRSVAKVMYEHEYIRLRVEGHTDTDEATNAKEAYSLSLARAEAACRFLSEHAGIDKARLECIGEGSGCGLGGAASANRRIEFHILQMPDSDDKPKGIVKL